MTQTTIEAHDFAVRRDDWTQGEFFARALDPPTEGEVLFRIDRYALTANNISYAVAGETLGYWRFFPAEDGWGRLPCFAFADVECSSHPEVQVGDRYFGYFPMSTHLIVLADRVRPDSLVDASEHRLPLPGVYNRYTKTSADPLHDLRYEDAQMLMQPLFTTSWLIDDFLTENDFFGAESVVLTSASSKTSIALASQLAQRSRVGVVGATSQRNVSFVQQVGFYDQVVNYHDVETLDAKSPVVMVDMAGDRELSRRLHHHFGENMKYDCIVGTTHWEHGGRDRNLPGAEPQFFFAPTQMKKRSEDWGAAGLMKRIGQAWVPFVRASDDWLDVVRHRGRDAIARAYAKVVAGECPPNEGQILSFWQT